MVDLRRARSFNLLHIVAIGDEHRLFRTHPPLKRRLKQLADIEARLQSQRRRLANEVRDIRLDSADFERPARRAPGCLDEAEVSPRRLLVPGGVPSGQ